MTFEVGTAADAAQRRAVVETFGTPEIAVDEQLARRVADFDSFDGALAFSYALNPDDYEAMQEDSPWNVTSWPPLRPRAKTLLWQ